MASDDLNERMMDRIMEWQADSFARMNTYTNLVMAGGYGHCTQGIIEDRRERVFNRRRKGGFYEASYVALVAIRSASECLCFMLPVREAEKAAQINLDRYYRIPKKGGAPHRPGKMWVPVDQSKREQKICGR
jgi:hypothetical protein